LGRVTPALGSKNGDGRGHGDRRPAGIPLDAQPAFIEVAPLTQPVAMLAIANLPATPVNDLQLSMVAAVEAVRQQRELQPEEIEHLRQRVPTAAHMAQYFKDAGMTNP
jgi:hypothetical protein